MNEFQLRQILKTLTGKPIALDTSIEISQVFAELVNSDALRLPCAAHELFVVNQRLSLLSDMRRGRRSFLLSELLSRYDETGLVHDSLLTGKDALFLVKLITSADQVQGWIAMMEPTTMEVVVKPLDEEYKLIAAPLKVFIPRMECN